MGLDGMGRAWVRMWVWVSCVRCYAVYFRRVHDCHFSESQMLHALASSPALSPIALMLLAARLWRHVVKRKPKDHSRTILGQLRLIFNSVLAFDGEREGMGAGKAT